MAHIAHQLTNLAQCVEGAVSRWLAGVVVWAGGGCTRRAATAAAWGASSIPNSSA
jgi:hypothetical protein